MQSKKAKSGAKRILLSRSFLIMILALVQIAVLVVLVYYFVPYGTWLYTIITILAVFLIIFIFEKDDLDPSYKMMWMFIIVLMPITGTLFYVMWGHSVVPPRQRRIMNQVNGQIDSALWQDDLPMARLKEAAPALGQSAHYLSIHAHSPLYPASGREEFYPLGEDFFPRFLDAIQAAKKYIFMEYYILEPGRMLDTTVEILRQKVKEGVDVRLVWDGFGSMFCLPSDYAKMLQDYGIKTCVFSPFKLDLFYTSYAMLNHRNHRKITVVDGEVAFTGGLNFADEYINEKKRFGQWKDTACMIRGEAVYSMTTIFLRTWDYVTGASSDYASFYIKPAETSAPSMETGYLQPYWDSPLDGENVSKNAYLNIIRHAQEYIYICTPYLILDQETIATITLAAKSGVDVRILTPGIPDKRLVYLVTQSYYRILLKEGVRLYEYTPGFNHAKQYVSDDQVAIIGSANMDYRSLYLHFENSVVFYGGPVVPGVKRDLLDCFAKAQEITLEQVQKTPPRKRLVQILTRFFAPMM